MKSIKFILVSLLLSTTLYSSDFFVDISTGYSNAPYTKKDLVGNIAINSLDENGYLYDIAVGYRFNEKIFSTLNYQYSKLKQIDFDDYYFTINYQFNHTLNPYLGVLLGKSFLHWNKDPLNSSKNIDHTSGSFMYGLQTGFEYKINERFSFIPKLIYSRTDHGTNLISLPAKSYLEHDSKLQLLLGFRFRF